MATYKDYLGSSYHYDELVRRLKSGEANIKTTSLSTGRIVQDESGAYVWFPDQGQPGAPEIISPSDLNKYYNPKTGEYRLTKQVPISPYIDLGNNPISGLTEWPVQDLGNGNYQLSVMNSGENGYSNLVFKADSTGKPTLPETAQAFFQPYNSGNFFSDITGEALNLATSDAGKMLALAAGAGVFSPAAAAGGAGALTGTDAALADLAASTPAFTGGGAAAAGGTGLLSGAAAAPELTAQQAAEMIAAEQAGSMTAADTLAAIQAEQAAAGVTGAGAAAGAAGAGAAGAGALTASELGKLGLIQGGLGLAGGLLQGQSAKGAAETLAGQQAALAEKTLQMGKFQPVGVTTRFGTSAFKTDPVTGAITPSYTLSSEAQAYQDALAKMGAQSLTAGQGLMNLGQQYIGESPEAVRQRYMETQLATLAPSQAQTLAEIRNRLQQTGRGGFATGATAPEAGGLMATSPELAAYYNSLADTQRKLAAQAEQQYQGQVQFGQGLLTGATKPFEGVFGAQRTVETAGQQPLGLSTDFANLVAQRAADQARNYATAMGASYQTQAGANAYNPFATAFQGASSNPLTAYGLSRLFS